jgi:hypothetical protein
LGTAAEAVPHQPIEEDLDKGSGTLLQGHLKFRVHFLMTGVACLLQGKLTPLQQLAALKKQQEEEKKKQMQQEAKPTQQQSLGGRPQLSQQQSFGQAQQFGQPQSPSPTPGQAVQQAFGSQQMAAQQLAPQMGQFTPLLPGQNRSPGPQQVSSGPVNIQTAAQQQLPGGHGFGQGFGPGQSVPGQGQQGQQVLGQGQQLLGQGQGFVQVQRVGFGQRQARAQGQQGLGQGQQALGQGQQALGQGQGFGQGQGVPLGQGVVQRPFSGQAPLQSQGRPGLAPSHIPQMQPGTQMSVGRQMGQAPNQGPNQGQKGGFQGGVGAPNPVLSPPAQSRPLLNAQQFRPQGAPMGGGFGTGPPVGFVNPPGVNGRPRMNAPAQQVGRHYLLHSTS